MPAAEQVPEPGRGVPLLRAPRRGEEAGDCGGGGGGGCSGEVGQGMACWAADKVLLPESGDFGASPGATGRGLPPPSSQRAAKEVWAGGIPCLFYLGAACCPPSLLLNRYPSASNDVL